MARQALLYATLCPLLCAQSTLPTNQPTSALLPEKLLIPNGEALPVIFLSAVSTATTEVGARVQLALERDLKMGGVTILPTGTPLTGIVTRSQRGVAGKKQAILDIQIQAIPLSAHAQLKLDARWHASRKQKAGETSLWILAAPMLVVASPLLVAMAVDEAKGKTKPTGEDVAHAMCSLATYYVAGDTLITTHDLDPAAAGKPVALQTLCPNKQRSGCTQAGTLTHCGNGKSAAALPEPASASGFKLAY